LIQMIYEEVPPRSPKKGTHSLRFCQAPVSLLQLESCKSEYFEILDVHRFQQVEEPLTNPSPGEGQRFDEYQRILVRRRLEGFSCQIMDALRGIPHQPDHDAQILIIFRIKIGQCSQPDGLRGVRQKGEDQMV
jgi:hypothetical protein